jgi:predicted regulator of Ras-like GTPase activity (Roadblock/LC7/MglB family)
MARAEAAEQEAQLPPDHDQELREALRELQKNLRGVQGSVIVDDQGKPLVWELRGGVEPMLVATAGAVLAKAASRTADILDLEGLRNTVLTTEQGSVAIFRILPGANLVTLLQPTANAILVLVEVGKTLERLRGVMHPG